MIRNCILGFVFFVTLVLFKLPLLAQDSCFLSTEARIEADTIILKVKAVHFDQIQSVQFAINFPTKNLHFVRGVANPLLNQASIGGNPDNCVFSWMPAPFNPVTLSTFDELVEFRFVIHTPDSEYCFDFEVPVFPLRMSSVLYSPHPSRGLQTCHSGLTGTVSGLLVADTDGDCLPDPGVVPVAFSGIELEHTDGQKYHAFAQSDGSFGLDLPLGTYTYHFIDPGFREYCNIPAQITIDSPGQIVPLDHAAKYLTDCPELEVQLTTPGLKRCSEVVFNLAYRNLGTSDAIDAFIEIQLDPELQLKDADLPFSSIGDQTFRFDLGLIKAGTKGLFAIRTSAPCDLSKLGQSICTSAEIFPNAPCLVNPFYDGAKLDIEASCDGNEAVFLIKNVGSGDMSQAIALTTVEDDVMPGIGGSLQLIKDGSQEFRFPANGRTIRIVLDTLPNHPYQLRYTKAIEGCGTGTISKGFLDNYSQGDEAPQVSVYCGELNDQILALSAKPEGMGEQKYIFREDRIYYTLRVVNDRLDTAFLIKVQVKLSDHLDVSTLQVYDHDNLYSWKILPGQLLEAEFRNPNLPPHGVDSLGSVLHFAYSIKPKADAPLRSLVENQSKYSINFGAYLNSNTTSHTLDQRIINSVKTQKELQSLLVYPNPITDRMYFQSGNFNLLGSVLEIQDLFGNLLIQKMISSDPVEDLSLGQLPSGIYFYQIISKSKDIFSGKIIKQ
ncbi:MAG: T9SS type A sorting domain-containing protein [Saprospiraceae bacterium]|nr:T9SS type A sorting domain-containing protein [Saprospiraceae bacterium]